MFQEIFKNPELLYKLSTGVIIFLYILFFIVLDPDKKAKKEGTLK